VRSSLYVGEVEHRRIKPVRHDFRYPVYFYCFDLDELEDLDRRIIGFGYNRFRPASVYDKDYLDAAVQPIRQKIAAVVEKSGKARNIRRVMLITSARYFHYVFNPVSFYYCLDDGDDPACIVAEVNNTFGEKHLYVLDEPLERVPGYLAHYMAEKSFHVSPFNNLSGRYEFFFSAIGPELNIRIILHREEGVVFEASLRGKSRPLTSRNLAAVMLKHPLMPHLSMPRILFEAARLFFQRKLSYIEKPVPMSAMTIRKKPVGKP